MRIGELASRADCTVETVRYYEREGLLGEPERSRSNYRLYGQEHLERLTFIRNCRALEMSLDEIRMLLALRDQPGHGCGGVAAILEEHIGHVEERIRRLTLLRDQLAGLRDRCRSESPVEECGILKGLACRESGENSEEAPGGCAGCAGNAGAHVHGAHPPGRAGKKGGKGRGR